MLDIDFELGSVATQAALAVICLITGAVFWLGDDYFAERQDVRRELDDDRAAFGLTHIDLAPTDRYERREGMARLSRRSGKAFVALGALFALVAAANWLI